MKRYKNLKVAIVLDGNRRYSKKLGLKLFQGHDYGAKKVEKLFDWCMELGIKELTLYSFSVENFNRSKEEVNFLMNLFRKHFKKLMKDERIEKDKIKINFIGRLDLFPKDIEEQMHEIMEKTRDYDNFTVNFALGYGGRQEIVDATKKIIEKINNKELKIEDIDENTFSNNLYLNSEPDIFIRPGGEKRISNFLLWQASYSELVFLEKLWPEFTKEDLLWCIEEFKKRERRFGK